MLWTVTYFKDIYVIDLPKFSGNMRSLIFFLTEEKFPLNGHEQIRVYVWNINISDSSK